MQKVVGRLKGHNLFRGFLMTLIRDVSHYNTREAEKEFKSFMKSVYDREDNFLSKLFRGRSGCMCVVNFEDGLFADYLNVLRSKHILTLACDRWKKSTDFESIFKIMLAQVMTDDDTDIEQYRLKMQLDSILQACLRLFLGNHETKVDYPEKFKFDQDVDGQRVRFTFEHEDLPLILLEESGEENKAPVDTPAQQEGERFSVEEGKATMMMNACQTLVNKFEENFPSRDDRNHSRWFRVLKQLLKGFLESRQRICLSRFEQLIRDTDIGEHKQKIARELEIVFQATARESLFCPRTCRVCDRECVLLENHKINCTCMTSHQCAHTCEILEECKLSGNAWKDRAKQREGVTQAN